MQNIRVNFRAEYKISGEGAGRNGLRFLVNFCYGLIINTMQISFVSIFWQVIQEDQRVKKITGKEKKKVKKDSKVIFALKKMQWEIL